MRTDLLALTSEDLTLLANRGLIKRATREMASGKVTFELQEQEGGAVAVRWSDGVECSFPAGGVFEDGLCSCPAVGVCRHLIRSVMAYQQEAAANAPEEAEEAAPAEPWDPGELTDEQLGQAFRKAALTRAKTELRKGLLVELVRSAKPTARFHGLSFTVRFLVPGDARYTSCDCGGAAPCKHVPLAVWAFRLLPAERTSGYVSTQQEAPAAPVELLDEVEAALMELCELGVAGASNVYGDRLRRLRGRCQDEGLVWPGEILDAAAGQLERYQNHDARFDPARVVSLVAELLIRGDAIRNDTGAVPQLLVRGHKTDRAARIGKARFMGLGCGATVRRGSAELAAYMQDTDSGAVVAVTREYADPEEDSGDEPAQLWRLGQRPVARGIALGALGAGQLLVQGARRTPGHRLILGRAPVSFNPQSYDWDTLRAPTLAEDFAEVRSRLGGMPPASLRPRRVAEDFHVCAVASVEAAEFSPAEQTVVATLLDAAGDRAYMVHPFTSRGREGTEALLALLCAAPEQGRRLRYVAGPARLSPSGVIFSPVSLVYDHQDGGRLAMLQPWVEEADELAPGSALDPGVEAAQTAPPEEEYPLLLQAALGELLLVGLTRADSRGVSQWQDLRRRGEALGFDRLVQPVARIAEALEQKAMSASWDFAATGRQVLELAVLTRVAREVSWGEG